MNREYEGEFSPEDIAMHAVLLDENAAEKENTEDLEAGRALYGALMESRTAESEEEEFEALSDALTENLEMMEKGSLSAGIRAYYSGDYDKAYRLLIDVTNVRKKDYKRDPDKAREIGEASLLLGKIYEDGLGRNADVQGAICHFKLSAEMGNEVGKLEYAKLILNDVGHRNSVKDKEKAVKHLRDAAFKEFERIQDYETSEHVAIDEFLKVAESMTCARSYAGDAEKLTYAIADKVKDRYLKTGYVDKAKDYAAIRREWFPVLIRMLGVVIYMLGVMHCAQGFLFLGGISEKLPVMGDVLFARLHINTIPVLKMMGGLFTNEFLYGLLVILVGNIMRFSFELTLTGENALTHIADMTPFGLMTFTAVYFYIANAKMFSAGNYVMVGDMIINPAIAIAIVLTSQLLMVSLGKVLGGVIRRAVWEEN